MVFGINVKHNRVLWPKQLGKLSVLKLDTPPLVRVQERPEREEDQFSVVRGSIDIF